MNDGKLSWVQQLASALEVRLKVDGSPRRDIEWLLLRCRDTLNLHGEIQMASARQLEVDYQAFITNRPLQQPNATRVRSKVSLCRDAAGCARGSLAAVVRSNATLGVPC